MPRVICASLALVLALGSGLGPARAASTPVVAVIDSGIQATHEEFRSGQVVAWRDFVAGAPAPYDDSGHGTAVASRIAGATLGTFPTADLIVAKVLNASNAATWDNVVAAMDWAVAAGADVMNVSVWQPLPNPVRTAEVGAAIDRATAAGVLVVWIAGNGGDDDLADGDLPLPAAVLPGSASAQALVVGAATDAGAPAPFSQALPDVLARGVGVTVARPGGYGTGNGTSYAAPAVAGMAARLLAEGAPRDPGWLSWVLRHVALDRPDVTYLQEGYGLLASTQMTAAVRIARGDDPVPGVDERDAFHLAALGPRTAQSGGLPSGALPPRALPRV